MSKELERLNEISKSMFDNSIKSFSQLKRLEMIIINIKIAVSKLGDNPEAKALSTTGDIIHSSLVELEQATKDIRDAGKEIGECVRLLNEEEE